MKEETKSTMWVIILMMALLIGLLFIVNSCSSDRNVTSHKKHVLKNYNQHHRERVVIFDGWKVGGI